MNAERKATRYVCRVCGCYLWRGDYSRSLFHPSQDGSGRGKGCPLVQATLWLDRDADKFEAQAIPGFGLLCECGAVWQGDAMGMEHPPHPTCGHRVCGASTGDLLSRMADFGDGRGPVVFWPSYVVCGVCGAEWMTREGAEPGFKVCTHYQPIPCAGSGSEPARFLRDYEGHSKRPDGELICFVRPLAAEVHL